jgi:spermidine synthase
VQVTFEAERLRYQVRSSAHEKLVIDNAHFGRMMMIDGIVLSSADAFIYHEMLSHVPLLSHGRVERVLILGGGDCGLAAEILRHRSVRTLVQVEADPQLVKLGRTYFPEINASVFRDRRFRLSIEDGVAFVASTDERFDLILVNAAGLQEATAPASAESFYRNVRGCLRPGGLVIATLGVPLLRLQGFRASLERLASVFPLVSCYLVPIPCVLGGPVAFGWASNVLSAESPGLDTLSARFSASRIKTRYYTPELHRASFALPRCIREVLDAATRPHERCEAQAAGGGRC